VRQCLCAILVVVAVSAPSPAVDVWLTRGDQASLLDHRPSISFQPGGGTHTVRIHVDPATTYQVMEGFGGAMTDSSAWLMQYRLSEAQRAALLDQIFSSQNGIGLSMLRVPMGASDFALSAYTYDDMPAGQVDPTLQQFSIAHDLAYIVPMLQQSQAINPAIRFQAVPWSPPAWMKNPPALYGGSLVSAYYAAYAQYFVKFVQAYEAQGLPIHAIAPQNEPLNTTTAFPACTMSTYQQAAFVGDHLGPALASAGIATKILIYDHNWDEWTYPVVVMNDPEVHAYAAGASFHGYAGDVVNQSLFHDHFPDKDVYFTEISGGDWATDFGDNLIWGTRNIIIGTVRNWSKSALFWNLALDENDGPHLAGGCGNCRGIVTINSSTGDVTREVEYYILGHAAKFVPPGARRMSSETVADVLETVAFRCPDGSEVLIALNPGTSSTYIDVVRGSEYFTYRLTGRSVATFIWKKYTPGDLNCDGHIDGADIAPFVLALLSPAQFAGQYPACDILAGDLDSDGAVTTQDIPLLAQLMLSN
jgi:O-glycosyl hydrolase